MWAGKRGSQQRRPGFVNLLSICGSMSIYSDSSLYKSDLPLEVYANQVLKINMSFFLLFKRNVGFPGGPVVKNPPANAGDTGSIPGLGRSHMPRSNWARAPQLLSAHATATEHVSHSY